MTNYQPRCNNGLWSLRCIQLMELQRNTHHVFRLMYHFVWIPKYLHKVFSEPYRSELKAIIQKIGYDYNVSNGMDSSSPDKSAPMCQNG